MVGGSWPLNMYGKISPPMFHEALTPVSWLVIWAVSPKQTRANSCFILLSLSLPNIRKVTPGPSNLRQEFPQVQFSRIDPWWHFLLDSKRENILNCLFSALKEVLCFQCFVSNNGFTLVYKLKFSIIEYLLKVNVGVKFSFSLDWLRMSG